MKLSEEERTKRNEKRNRTLKEREAKAAADANDYPAAIALCRRIRDDENAVGADRLAAIRLIMELQEQKSSRDY